VDTDRYGSGWWRVIGTEWRVDPNGAEETTLVLTPKEDGVAPDADLLASAEVVPSYPISGLQIPDNSITTEKIAPGEISTEDLADGAVGSDQIGAGAVTDDKIENVDAGKVVGDGDLAVGGPTDPPSGRAASIQVYSTNGELLGSWNGEGLLIRNTADPMLLVRLTEGTLSFSDDGGLSWGTAINADGINATALRVGHFDGGSNRVSNSGFEIALFSIESFEDWTVIGEWQAHLPATDLNVDDTGSSGNLRLSSVAY
jgi:hypothetical protein